jgi:hypothetical protein
MKSREERIAFDMNYCQHYGRGQGTEMICKAGMDIGKIKCVPTGSRGIKWGPCIEGHTLTNPHEHCPKWIRRTREMGEERADAIEASIKRMTTVMPVVAKWRTWTEKSPVAKQEVIECPLCRGRLHLSQAAYNGHVWGKCETPECVSWMQ